MSLTAVQLNKLTNTWRTLMLLLQCLSQLIILTEVMINTPPFRLCHSQGLNIFLNFFRSVGRKNCSFMSHMKTQNSMKRTFRKLPLTTIQSPRSSAAKNFWKVHPWSCLLSIFLNLIMTDFQSLKRPEPWTVQ